MNRFLPPHPVRTRRERIARRITGGIVALAVAGVIATGLPAWATAPTPSMPERDIATWTMPLDQFVPASSTAENYAENLQIEPCMSGAGFDWPAVRRNYAEVDYVDDDVAIPSPLSMEQAASRGYHFPEISDEGRDAAIEMNSRKLSDEQSEALNRCIVEVRKTRPIFPANLFTTGLIAVEISRSAYAEALADPAVVDAAAAWRTCLEPEIDKRLPESPDLMPGIELANDFGTLTDGSPVSAGEKDLAQLDVTCQYSSGYRAALYDAEWTRQATVPATDAAAFARAGDRILRARQATLELLTRIDVPTP